ncbi:unnamed protein product, partial [Mycena citricolor]
ACPGLPDLETRSPERTRYRILIRSSIQNSSLEELRAPAGSDFRKNIQFYPLILWISATISLNARPIMAQNNANDPPATDDCGPGFLTKCEHELNCGKRGRRP